MAQTDPDAPQQQTQRSTPNRRRATRLAGAALAWTAVLAGFGILTSVQTGGLAAASIEIARAGLTPGSARDTSLSQNPDATSTSKPKATPPGQSHKPRPSPSPASLPSPTSNPTPSSYPTPSPSPVSLPSPSPSPVPVPSPVAAGYRLSWAPPTLVNPVTVTLCDCNISGGSIIVNLAAGQDYILRDPAVLHNPVQIIGGHNVVWIGGDIQPSTWLATGAIKLQHVGIGGGTVHLEGINIGGVLNDAIIGGEYSNLYKPSGTLADATLQVENIRIGQLSGNSLLQHQDCIQSYGGWKNLRVDRFTCQTPYQGFFLPWEDGVSNNQGVLSHFDIRNANLYDSPASAGSSFQTLIHFGDRNGSFTATTHQQTGNLSNVYLRATQRTCNQETYPNSGTSSSDGTVVHSTIRADGTITWASTWAIPGYVTPGVPPGGDFVPPGVAGVGYVSPGYL